MTDPETLWGAQTALAMQNFPISSQPMPPAFIAALGAVKAAGARANGELGVLEPAVATAIAEAADGIAAGAHIDQFPVDRYQTGSGTSTNMNANEVIAALASRRLGRAVHANDQVNASQSSNDVIPSSAHVAAALALHRELVPALCHLETVIRRRAEELRSVIKTGRTHLMDALPLSLGQELSGWAAQLEQARARLQATQPALLQLAIGGTAVGTGVNAPRGFAEAVCAHLQRWSGLGFGPAPNRFAALASVDALCALSGQLKGLAAVLMKISNDLRWMNSGPQAGLGEIALPALQPGSSIMPGKVNPVIPEAVCMVAARVIGNDLSVTLAAQSGNFQLNVMWPLAACSVLESLDLLARSSLLLADRAIAGFTVQHAQLAATLDRNPILVTALNTRIGYEAGARIAKRAYAEGRALIDVAREETDLAEDELRTLLDPERLAYPDRD
jgi:fumarate hydratase, class II